MKTLKKAAAIGARRAWMWRNRNLFRHRGEGHFPRLLVDVSAIIRHDARTGIQRVVRAFWSELAQRSGDGFVAIPVFATHRRGYCYAPRDFLDRRPHRLDGEAVGLRGGDQFLGLDLSAHLLPKYRQQLAAWRHFGGKARLVVYDLLPMQRPEWFTEAAVNNFRNWFDVLNKDVDEALCISDQVAMQLVDHLGEQGPSVGRIHMGADISASRPSVGVSPEVHSTLQKMLSRPSVVMVGTIEPRKGYDSAIAAFDYLRQHEPTSPMNLVIVGRSGWKTSAIQSQLLSHPELGRTLFWLDRVTDEGLGLLYDAAKGVLVGSRAEGFGLPLLEAAAHRRPVLARDLSVFREQRLPNVAYFQDDSAANLAKQLIALTKTKFDARPAKLPTWSESVDRLLVDIGLREKDVRIPERSLLQA